MRTLAFTRRVIAFIALLPYATLVTSCTSWQTQVKPVREVIETGRRVYGGGHKPLSSIRVYSSGEAPVILYKPRLSGDSLLGTTKHTAPVAVPPDWSGACTVRWVSVAEPAAIPLDSTRSVEVSCVQPEEDGPVLGDRLGIDDRGVSGDRLGKI